MKTESKTYSCDSIILGMLHRESTINQGGKIFIDIPGGNLLYTAYAFTLWGKTAGLVARTGSDFPDEWITEIGTNSINTIGITKNSDYIDSRNFQLVDGNKNIIQNDPQKYFSKNNLPFPKSLLGYQKISPAIDNRIQDMGYTIHPENFPNTFFNCRHLAVCPVDYLTHNLIPAYFRSRSGGDVFIHAGKSYSHTSFYNDFPPLVNGASVLLISEENARKIFLGKSENIMQIAEILASFGVEIVIISLLLKGYIIFNKHTKNKYFIPLYPTNCIDPIGVDDAFFGGFLAGFLTNFDPIQSAVMGSVTASVKYEGSTPNYLLGTFKDLLKARVDLLMGQVKAI